MRSEYKVAAYITAYKDREALMLCLNAINGQSVSVEKILVVDNSPEAICPQLSCDSKLTVRLCPENIGIGAGLSWAISLAIQEGYDFLWAFDQDSIASIDCLENLLLTYKEISSNNYKVGIIAPTSIDPRTKKIIQGAVFDKDHFIGCKPKSNKVPYECDAPITSGSLISLAAAKTIAPPFDHLFIDGVDLDYGMRLREKGFHNVIVPRAVLWHNFGIPHEVRFLTKTFIFHSYSRLRHYYICRNHTYLGIHYSRGYYRLICCLRRAKYAFYTMIKIFIYDKSEDKLSKIFACLLGTYHGFINNFAKLS